MLTRILVSALLAGLLAGLFLTALQWAGTVPLIHEAELYEEAAPAPGYEGVHEGAAEPEAGLMRIGLTALSNLLAAVGFALLLNAAFALKGSADFRRGLLWGLGGFAAFSLAPALGLPPELPGAAVADLAHRQLWWLLAVVLTAGGLALVAFGPRAVLKLAGLALIALPHLIGAPEAPGGGTAPEELARSFTLAVLATSAAFWLVLGGLSGLFFRRFG